MIVITGLWDGIFHLRILMFDHGADAKYKADLVSHVGG